MPELLEEAKRIGQVDVLIIDPIVSAIKGEVRRNLQPVVEFAERTGCAVIGITHLTKRTQGQDPIDRITGSLAFGAVPRLVLLATREQQSSDANGLRRGVLTQIKSNIGPDGGGFYYGIEEVELRSGIKASKVKWLGVAEGDAREIIALAEAKLDEHQASAIDATVEFLRQELAEGSVPATDLFKAATRVGITKSTLNRVKRKAGVKVVKQGQKGAKALGSGPYRLTASNRVRPTPTPMQDIKVLKIPSLMILTILIERTSKALKLIKMVSRKAMVTLLP
jgi:hypothetical protein